MLSKKERVYISFKKEINFDCHKIIPKSPVLDAWLSLKHVGQKVTFHVLLSHFSSST